MSPSPPNTGGKSGGEVWCRHLVNHAHQSYWRNLDDWNLHDFKCF